MKNESDVNNDIFKTLMLIQEEYPELSKYLVEMRVTIPDESQPVITVETLELYDDSLKSLLTKYSKNKPTANSDQIQNQETQPKIG